MIGILKYANPFVKPIQDNCTYFTIYSSNLVKYENTEHMLFLRKSISAISVVVFVGNVCVGELHRQS